MKKITILSMSKMTSKEKYALLDKYNLCHKCEKAKQMPNRKFCPECLEKISNDNQKRYNPEKAHEYQKRRREIYAEKKNNGICIRCTAPATHGLYCYEHSISAKRRSQETSARRKRERHERGLITDYRLEHGLCLRCGQTNDTNTKLCSKCCEVNRVNSALADKSEWRLQIRSECNARKIQKKI